MTDTNIEIEINYALCEFLKRVYLVFGRDGNAWLKQDKILSFWDFRTTLRFDIQRKLDGQYLLNWMFNNQYITESLQFTDKFVQEIVNV